MAASTQILRQYLVSIGFAVDEKGGKGADRELTKFEKKATSLAYSFAGAASAAGAMVLSFSKQMEKLYYSSKKAEAAASNLQALEYAGQQMGLGAGQMTASLEALARNLRANPGLIGLLENMGVQVQGRDKADVMVDLVKALKGMPFYAAQQFAQLFGIDPDELYLLQQSVEQLEKLRDERKKMAQEFGVDTDEASKAGLEMAQQWRQMTEQVGLLKDALSIALLPAMRELGGITKDLTKDWIKIVQMTPQNFWGTMLDGVRDAAGIRAGGNGSGVQVSASGRARTFTAAERAALAAMDSDFKRGGAGTPYPGSGIDPTLLSRLEAQYGLPAGMLDRMWAKESDRGRAMRSPKGARGHFGLMPGTQAELGVSDPDDFVESANGAARYLAMLRDRYGGDMQKATAAYNWGLGNVDRKGLGSAPWETRDYVQSLTGQPIQVQQTNQFTITAPNPESAARQTFESLSTANRDLTRNLSGSLD